MGNTYPAERFHPGDLIREEIEVRGWTQTDLGQITGLDRTTLSLILNGKRRLTEATATVIAEALGTTAEFLLRFQVAYDVWKKRPHKGDVAQRARLWAAAPMKVLLKRRWIEPSENVDVLEQRVCQFFGIGSLDEQPRFYGAARKTGEDDLTKEQLAWLFRAHALAKSTHAANFSISSLNAAFNRLRPIKRSEEDIRLIPKVLADAGVRLVVIEALPGSRIDGACMWLDAKSPVVAMSFRYDRIDWFWFTLMHELKHVANKDGFKRHRPVDIRLVGKDAEPRENKQDFERAADEFATEFLVPQSELDDFIARTAPLYSKRKLTNFAARIQVHPGIVVGQLQFRKEIPYSHSKETQVPVKENLIESTVTDGWDHIIAASL